MKIPFSPNSRILIFRHLRILAPVAALAWLPACATSNWFKQADSPLPIETVPAQSRRLVSTQARESSDRLYVSGRANSSQFGAPHVDVQLIARDGQVLAENRDALNSPAHSRTTHRRNRTQTYVVSFPLREARQATKIRVVVHQGGHPDPAS